MPTAELYPPREYVSREPLLSLHKISVRRQGPHGEVWSPEPAIHLELRPGTATVNVGPNGSDKSTPALVAVGLLKPHRGEVVPGTALLATAAADRSR